MSLRSTAKWSIIGLALTLCSTAEGARPNILWIIAENMSPELGCYGERLVHAPNLDGLARQGVRYSKAYVTGPVCSPSRSALNTGMYQTSIDAHHHRSHRRDDYRLPEGVEVITEYFRRAGYFTANVLTAAPGVRGTGKTDFNFSVDENGETRDDDIEALQRRGQSAFDGTDWNQRRPGQPFFAQINFVQTHRPYERAKEHPVDPDEVVLPPSYPDHPLFRQDWAEYLDTVGRLDENVGPVLKRLDDEGLRDDTIVFFFSDHGAFHVRGGLWLYEGGIHVPLIVRIPRPFRVAGQGQPDTVCHDLVSAIDIAATSLELAGIALPPTMEGRPFLGTNVRKREFIVAARDRVDETVDRIRCIRTERFKYIRNFYPEQPYTQRNRWNEAYMPTWNLMKQLQHEGKMTPAQARFMAPRRPFEELYDLEVDPHELKNLAGSPDHREVLASLRTKLDQWMRETGDRGGIPEDPKVIEYWLEDMEKLFGGHEWKPKDELE